jgi:hypothetical protein
MDHFPDTARYTLEPLRQVGQACLECAEIRALKFVVLTEVQFDWGGPYNEREIRRAKNLFAALRQRGIKLPAQPQLRRASFSIFFRGTKKPRQLVVIPPNVAHYARDDDSFIVDQWLALRGFIRTPAPEPNEHSTEQVLAGT